MDMTIEEPLHLHRNAAETLCQIISRLDEIEGKSRKLGCGTFAHNEENARHFQNAKAALGVLLANAVMGMFFLGGAVSEKERFVVYNSQEEMERAESLIRKAKESKEK